MSRPKGKESKRRGGVVRADIDVPSGTATVVYDETRVASDDIKTFIADCGYHCHGEVVNMKTLKEAR